MQTFFTDTNLYISASRLDPKRLNKQILEAWQIIEKLEHRNVTSYMNNPAIVMWRDYTDGLKAYYNAHLWYWNTFYAQEPHSLQSKSVEKVVLPPWWSENDILRSHQAMLYRKDPTYYAQWWYQNTQYAGYTWPSDLYRNYYKILYTIEDDFWYDPEEFSTRKEAIGFIEDFMLSAYGAFTKERGGSRSYLERNQNGDLLIRIQPVRFIDYLDV